MGYQVVLRTLAMQANGDSFVRCSKDMGLTRDLTLSDVLGRAIGMGRGILVGRAFGATSKQLAWLVRRTQSAP